MGGWKYEWGLVGNVCLVLMLWKLFVILLLVIVGVGLCCMYVFYENKVVNLLELCFVLKVLNKMRS